MFAGDGEEDIFFNGYARYVDAEMGPVEVSVDDEFGSTVDMHVVVVVPLSKSSFCLNLLSQIFLDTFPMDFSGTLRCVTLLFFVVVEELINDLFIYVVFCFLNRSVVVGTRAGNLVRCF